MSTLKESSSIEYESLTELGDRLLQQTYEAVLARVADILKNSHF